MRRLLLVLLALCLPLALAGCRRAASWSPTGDRLVIDSGEGLFLFQRETGAFALVPMPEGEPINPAWSPDGKQVVYYVMRTEGGDVAGVDLAITNVESGEVTPLFSNVFPVNAAGARQLPGIGVLFAPNSIRQLFKMLCIPAWQPGADRIAFVAKQDELVLYTCKADGSEAAPLVPSARAQALPTWSPDGKQLAFYSLPSSQTILRGLERPDAALDVQANLEIVNADGTGRRILWDGAQKPGLVGMTEPEWSADGREIAVLVADSSKQIRVGIANIDMHAWVVPAAGGASRRLWPVTTPIAQFGRDLKSIIYVGGTKDAVLVRKTWPFTSARLYDGIPLGLTAGNPFDLLEAPPILPFPAHSPDGKTMAVLSARGLGQSSVLHLIDIASGKDQTFILP